MLLLWIKQAAEQRNYSYVHTNEIYQQDDIIVMESSKNGGFEMPGTGTTSAQSGGAEFAGGIIKSCRAKIVYWLTECWNNLCLISTL